MLLFICCHGLEEIQRCLFKYISCYCLSKNWQKRRRRLAIQIHLMLLFILFLPLFSLYLLHSNTSHVIVYRNVHKRNYNGRGIQIHLMLLFILLCQQPPQLHQLFKYISCYCLSVMDENLKIVGLHSNTSHVIVYHCFRSHRFSKPKNSNTSHVIVYPIRMAKPWIWWQNSNTSHVIVYL